MQRAPRLCRPQIRGTGVPENGGPFPGIKMADPIHQFLNSSFPRRLYQMKVGRFATQCHYSMIAFALMSVCLSRAALAQDGHTPMLTTSRTDAGPTEQG